MRLNRRQWLALAAGTLTAGAMAQNEESKKPTPAFHHRGYLGWITDLASRPDTYADWPSMRLDEDLLRDYTNTFDLMQSLGFNEISIWGLYVSRAWPVDIASSVEAERGKKVESLIDDVHRHGIRVYSGLGVYSWGFENIIQQYPDLSRGNSQAMCASNPDSWKWMQKVIDFVFTRFSIDGVSMQSADQGRCRCEQCKAHSDAEYHALLNIRSADYIRSRWPDKTVAVNSWGLRFGDPTAWPAIIAMSEKIDYLIDVNDSSRSASHEDRQKLIASLKCDFGTIGGPQVEPPQHWVRDRWFLPSPRRIYQHLADLYADGGRACEFFYHILANPGDEITFWTTGKALSNPQGDFQKHLQESIAQLYEFKSQSDVEELTQIILDAEDAYYQYLSSNHCGTIALEPLIGNSPGHSVYLEQLQPTQRREYKISLESLLQRANQLLKAHPQHSRLKKITVCLKNGLKDVKPLL